VSECVRGVGRSSSVMPPSATPARKRGAPSHLPSIRKANSSSRASNVWKLVDHPHRRLNFVDFVSERQQIFELRQLKKPPPWTEDAVLQHGRFCNIDRRNDFVTSELLTQLKEHVEWSNRDRLLLALALRFTGSRRGEASAIAALVEAGRHMKDRAATPLVVALKSGLVRCGVGTYQLSLNRRQVATVIEATAQEVAEHIAQRRPFPSVLDASDFVAERMTVGKRPQFSANEAAKDFAYIDGIMDLRSSSHRCRLGPGARKGLTLVRGTEASVVPQGLDDEAAVQVLRAALRERPRLFWMEAIDVEQALCEFSKYETYASTGVSAGKRFSPASCS
jgi:hypothetical protein